MHRIYIYQWTWSENYVVEIRGYGLLDGKLVCIMIDDFLPHLYVLDVHGLDLSRCTKRSLSERSNLYNFNNGQQIFHKLQFRTKAAAYAFVRDHNLDGKAHEHNASPLLQFTTQRKLPQVGWVQFSGTPTESETCALAYEVAWDAVEPAEGPFVEPLACAFDLEVYSTVPGAMPSNKPGDEIFQISAVFSDGEEYLLSLDGKDYGPSVVQCATEQDLLRAFFSLVRRKKPLLLYGYNILGFDIHYLIQRCTRLCLLDEAMRLGHGPCDAEIKTVHWASGAFGQQDFTYIDWEGIVILDLYPIVKRDYKFSNFKLETVAQELLGYGKDPITFKDIMRAYESREMARVGHYCLKDARLCLELAAKMSTWIGLVQMANVCHVQPTTLYLHGQQIKIYSQVYHYCHWNNIVVNTNVYKTPASIKYTGAYVMDPVPGLYENVVPFDFSSLYPSIIITENICYSTIAGATVPDSQCKIFAWEDHSGCEHDPKVIAAGKVSQKIDAIEKEIVSLRRRRDELKGAARKSLQKTIDQKRLEQRPLRKARADFKAQKKYIICAKHRYRFIKASEKPGVVPAIIQNLLNARKEIRARLKQEPDALTRNIMDKQQLAYKISANSMYGAMGVRSGYLPYMPGAMTITHCGREAIKKSLAIIERDFNGRVIYGDTDSNYVQFPTVPRENLWAFAVEVAAKVSAHFPKTMSLEFEEKLYHQFILLGKKKYVYLEWARGESKIGHKGVLVSRRDNAKVIRSIYMDCLEEIFSSHSEDRLVALLIDRLSRLGSMYACDDFVLTKSVGCADGEYDEETGQVGDYKVTKPAGSAEEGWYEARLPAHVQLAKKMCKRGIPVQAGTRLEIVVLDKPGAVKLGDKFEDLDHYKERAWHLKLDMNYYLKSAVNPLDQLLSAVFGKTFVGELTKTLFAKAACLRAIRLRKRPKLKFIANLHSYT